MLISELKLINLFCCFIKWEFFLRMVFVCLNAWCSNSLLDRLFLLPSPDFALWSSAISQASACNFSSVAFVTGGNIMLIFFVVGGLVFCLFFLVLFLVFFPARVHLHCFYYPVLIPPQMSANVFCWSNLQMLLASRTRGT